MLQIRRAFKQASDKSTEKYKDKQGGETKGTGKEQEKAGLPVRLPAGGRTPFVTCPAVTDTSLERDGGREDAF